MCKKAIVVHCTVLIILPCVLGPTSNLLQHLHVPGHPQALLLDKDVVPELPGSVLCLQLYVKQLNACISVKSEMSISSIN